LLILTIFSISLAFAVASSIYFLRIHFYPEGFQFPLNPISGTPLLVEYCREASSLIIISIVSYLMGKNFREKIASFLFIFGVWDIFYYVWLYFMLNWPSSLMTWDLLYVIPGLWVGPVLAPLIVCGVLISTALVIFYFENKNIKIPFSKKMWAIEIIAGLGVVISFIWNFKAVYRSSELHFPWWLFILSLLIGIITFYYPVLKYNVRDKK